MALTEGGLWLFAGCNGAGKSTFIEAATRPGGEIEGVSILNPDRLTKELLQGEGFDDYASVPDEVYRRCFISAAESMETAAVQQLKAGMPVCIETVLSTPKYLPLVDVATKAGLPFNLVYVTLRTPLLACQRVANRVRTGGHPVPEDKIISRYYRSLDNLPVFAQRATHFRVYDNSDSTSAKPRLVAEGAGQGYILTANNTPWITEKLSLMISGSKRAGK